MPEAEDNIEDKEVYILSPYQREQLVKAFNEVKEGNFLTNSEANEKASEWLKD